MLKDYRNTIKIALLGALLISLSSCKEDPVTPVETLPTSYNFENVNYSGQTVRLMLGDTLSRRIKALKDAGASAMTKNEMESFFTNSGNLFANIATGKKLSDKIVGGENGLLATQFRAWFDTIEVRSTQFAGSMEAVTTSDGLYLPEFTEKNIMGAVYYYQAMNYLKELELADNNTVKAGEGTTMQHNWDEAFGYFGASKNYGNFTTDERSANPSVKDINGDGKIDPATEKNFFFARYAASRDKNYSVFTSQPTNFAQTIFDAFIKGRNAINKKNYSDRDAASLVIKQTWDKIIGASAVKYAIDVKTNISNPAKLNGPWAELTMFVQMTQFNDKSVLTSDKRAQVQALLGSKPSEITAEKIEQVISMLKTAYNF